MNIVLPLSGVPLLTFLFHEEESVLKLQFLAIGNMHLPRRITMTAKSSAVLIKEA
jgi:hypothetical protein